MSKLLLAVTEHLTIPRHHVRFHYRHGPFINFSYLFKRSLLRTHHMPGTTGSASFNGGQSDHSGSQNPSSSGGKGIIRMSTQITIVLGERKEKGPQC